MEANTVKSILSYIGSGFVGALVVAVIQWFRASRSERQKRHSEYIHEQLRKLYGPLYFLSSQNEELIKLSKEILATYKKHFEGNKWSDNSETQATLKKEGKATIELANEYMSQVIDNNEQIVELLQNNYALVDSDDLKVLKDFVIDSIRMNKEIKDERLKDIPPEIYYSLGEISYSRPEFLSRISSQFFSKQNTLRRYH